MFYADNEGKKYSFHPTKGHQSQEKKSSNYFVLVTHTYCLSKSKQVFKLALAEHTASIVRLDSITLTDSILPQVELSMYLRSMLISVLKG